ncbi:CapA family protein [Verticiella sediminum]|uniref:CapA family protein n=1 Tax=Verticiella sediminum TaxID=1247510 RepID=A0A556B1Y2_9BURK|nr:CapA family protein [Verticiella sediminum]TSH99164.1 CapA family protein [Verticiella sediminum]
MASAILALAGDFVAIRPQHAPGEKACAVHALLHASDLAIGNFEMALAEGGVPLEKTGVRRADPAVGPTLGVIGFDVLSVANNHTVDYGWEGLESTMRSLRGAGCSVIGGGSTLDEAAAPVIRHVNGLRIGVLAYSCLTPAGARATEAGPGIACIRIRTSYEINPLIQIEEPGDPSAVAIRTWPLDEDLRDAVRRVRQLREQCEHVVVSLHWGFGSGGALAEYQAPLARSLIDAGASVIHGHHPHAVQGVEFHRGRPILYSAGIYMAEQWSQPASPVVMKMRAGMSKDGYVAYVQLCAGEVARVCLHPIVLDDAHQPTRATGTDFERIARQLVWLSTPLGTRIAVEGAAICAAPSGQTINQG